MCNDNTNLKVNPMIDIQIKKKIIMYTNPQSYLPLNIFMIIHMSISHIIYKNYKIFIFCYKIVKNNKTTIKLNLIYLLKI